MTNKEAESYMQRLADSIELAAELQKVRGELEAVKNENSYLRGLVEEKFRQSVVSSQVCRLYVPEANTTAGNCANCGKPSWQH